MKRYSTILFVLLALALMAFSARAEEPKGGDKQKGMQKTKSDDVNDFISINSILMYISNNGMTAHNPTTDASGLEWPRGSAKYCIFTDGLIWGGKVQGEVRVGGATYRYGLQAGSLPNDGSPADPSNPDYRIYKVRKVDAAAFAAMSADEQTRLRNDFLNWPVKDGAPWVDKNKNGHYDVNFDEWLALGETATSDTPWFIGDEVLWFVSNDMNPARTSNLYGSSPIGLEVQTLVWGYNQTGPLGNMVFTKYTVINKGTDNLTEAYFSKWSDPDLGDANDDFCGVDTALVLGYVYNALAKDGVYGIPPAAGYDFFQGPIIRGEQTDVAHYNFGLREGWKNLGVTSFAFYINGDGIYKDPTLGSPSGAQEMYYYMQSKLWNGSLFIDPTTGLNVQVCLAGDPIKKTGWVDGISRGPGDRRFLMTVGPFTLATKDTQEVVVASIVGRGSDRLSSFQVLKYYDRFAQLAFDNNFDLPKAPPQPKVTITPLPNRLILSWGDQEQVKQMENFNDRGYKFQGYNIYQFPTSSSTLADAKRIATFDLVDNIATIFDEVIDERSGAIVTLPVQFGSDAGIQHMISLTNDYFTDRTLVNNQPYYYAVTTYSYNEQPDIVPRQLESTPKILTARPQSPDPGWRNQATADDAIDIMHTTGSSTGEVMVEVIDPKALTGDTYEVTFDSLGVAQVIVDPDTMYFANYASWNLTNVTTADQSKKKPVVGCTAFKGLESDYMVIDGFRIGLSGSGYWNPEHEVLRTDWIGGVLPYTGSDGADWEAGYLFFGSSIAGYEIKETVEIRFDRTKTSKGYMYLRGGSPNYVCAGYFDSPIQVFDVSDKNNPRQLQWAFVEQNGSPVNDHIWDPSQTAADREYIFILRDTYSDTPDPTYTGYRINSNAGQMPILYAAWLTQRANFGTKLPWRDGDIWRITPNVPFGKDDKYTFTTKKPQFSVVAEKQDVTKINVFPNPYLGSNAQELNKYQRFVTFNHLPQHAIFKIYSVSGSLVRSFEKNDASQLTNWDLLNDNRLPVSSGMYIIHISMPELNTEKVLKLGIVVEQQYLDRI
jgi:hypothetical protein